MNDSFAKQTKEKLSANIPKKQCCKKSLLSGILLFSSRSKDGSAHFSCECQQVITLSERLLLELYGISSDIAYSGSGYRIDFYDKTDIFISRYKNLGKVFDCPDCVFAFLRGVFLAKGTVNDPSKERHLEIYVSSAGAAESISDLISAHITRPHVVDRAGKYSLYYKDTDNICDFLNLIGASYAAFGIINSQIESKLKSDIRRRINFESANIEKTVRAAAAQCAAVEKIIASGKTDMLPPELKTTALLRIENRELSITELAAVHDPPITKSGLNHRLQKIISFAEDIK